MANLIFIIMVLVPADNDDPDWTHLKFHGDYQIEKLVLNIPKNVDAPSKQGIFVDDKTELTNIEITDKKKIAFLQTSLAPFLGLEQHGFVSSYSQIGQIRVITTKRTFIIGVSDAGFTLGADFPSQKNIFFEWALAKLVDDAAKNSNGKGLKKSLLMCCLANTGWILQEIDSKHYLNNLQTNDLDRGISIRSTRSQTCACFRNG